MELTVSLRSDRNSRVILTLDAHPFPALLLTVNRLPYELWCCKVSESAYPDAMTLIATERKEKYTDNTVFGRGVMTLVPSVPLTECPNGRVSVWLICMPSFVSIFVLFHIESPRSFHSSLLSDCILLFYPHISPFTCSFHVRLHTVHRSNP